MITFLTLNGRTRGRATKFRATTIEIKYEKTLDGIEPDGKSKLIIDLSGTYPQIKDMEK